MAGLPLFKLGALLLRTLAKPVAKSLKERASSESALVHPPPRERECLAAHENFRGIVIQVGNTLNQVQTQIEVRLLGHVPKNIKPLREDLAVAMGAEFLSEAFIFGVAAGVLIVEVARQNDSKNRELEHKAKTEADKAAAREARFKAVEKSLSRLDSRLDKLEKVLWLSRPDGSEERQLLEQEISAARDAETAIVQAEIDSMKAAISKPSKKQPKEATSKTDTDTEPVVAAAKESAQAVSQGTWSFMTMISEALKETSPVWSNGMSPKRPAEEVMADVPVQAHPPPGDIDCGKPVAAASAEWGRV
jgi:optic atrophy 3 protein